MTGAELYVFPDDSRNREEPLAIPGATPDGFMTWSVNDDLARGPIVFAVRMKPGTRIAAHRHDGAEAHLVLEGDFVNDGVRCPPGTYLAHAAGVVHGPHESADGCVILTFRDRAGVGFEVAEGGG